MSIEGIPDGWELVRIGEIQHGEFFIHSDGCILQHDENTNVRMNKNYVIIRKKPKRYRPFANAAEFEPFRDRWVRHKSNSDSCMRIDGYGNKGVTIQGCVHDFDVMFEYRTFDDGTPFGIEVTE